METNKELDIVEQILVELWEDEDQDTIWTVVEEIRKRLDNPKFAADLSNPSEDIYDDDDGEDPDENEFPDD